MLGGGHGRATQGEVFLLAKKHKILMPPNPRHRPHPTAPLPHNPPNKTKLRGMEKNDPGPYEGNMLKRPGNGENEKLP